MSGQERKSTLAGALYIMALVLAGMYFTFASVQGDFGLSFYHRRPVLDVIAERLPATIELSLVALIIALVTAIPLAALPVSIATLFISPPTVTSRLAPSVSVGPAAVAMVCEAASEVTLMLSVPGAAASVTDALAMFSSAAVAFLPCSAVGE